MIFGQGTGKSTDQTAEFTIVQAMLKDASIYTTTLLSIGSAFPAVAKTLTELLALGKIKAIVSKSYPLSEARQALSDLSASKVFGKLVLIPKVGNNFFTVSLKFLPNRC